MMKLIPRELLLAVDPRPPDPVPTSIPSSTPAPVCFPSGGEGKNSEWAQTQIRLKEKKKKALLIRVTIFFFPKTLKQRKFSASRNSLNQSHMWTQSQWLFSFPPNVTGFSDTLIFFLLPIISISNFFFFFKDPRHDTRPFNQAGRMQKICSVWNQREIKDIEGRKNPRLVKTNKQL